jgi:hypothetical protein
MRRRGRWLAGFVVVVAMLPAACAKVAEEEEGINEPATVEPVEGNPDVLRVTVTAEAAERLDIRSSRVRAAGESASGTVIPYAAVFYTANGDTWTYTSPEPLTFVREAIVIDDIVGNRAFLSDGPASGTTVVTQGAAELYGTETGVEE